MGSTDLVATLVPEWPQPERRIISVPTRGAFAEAKLSNCNACEVIDDTRFWDWQESPCTCEAPEITGIQPRDRAQDTVLTPSASPSTIGVEGTPSEPDPTGMANILELLGRSDVFRDMSGRQELASVMQAVVNGAVQLQMERLRQEAAARQQQGASSGTRGGTASSPTSSTPTSTGTSASTSNPVRLHEQAHRMAEEAINRAERNNQIAPATAASLRQRLAESRVQHVEELDPINITGTNPQAAASAQRPAPRTGPRGTAVNPWIIDNFLVDRPELPNRTTDNVLVSQLLDEIATAIREQPGDGIVYVVGHADQSGEQTYNLNLGSDRATEVSMELINRGVPGGLRMRPSSRGEGQPRSTRHEDAQGHNPYNRRVEIWIGPIDRNVTTSLDCNIHYSGIPLIAQPNKLACWAASAAMMISYSQRRSFTPEMVARRMGHNLRESTSEPLMVRLISDFGFQTISLPGNLSLVTTPGQWCEWLTAHGPLWVTIVGNPSHAIVVHGLVGDGENARVYILNPWDTNTHFDSDPVDFNPPNRGRSYTTFFRDFRNDFGNLGLADYGRWRILYLPR
jgi:hypothetical protein